MRILFLIAVLLIAVQSSPINAYEQDKMIKFEYDMHQESPVGLYIEGLLDPRNDNQSKLQTFLKLANKYIPILESIAMNENSLKWERYWHFDFLGVNIDAYYYFQLIVGWRVNPGGITDDRFDVTYTPFVWGGTYGRLNGTTWPAVGSTEAGLQYVYTYAPISVQLFKAGKICFEGVYHVEPIIFRNHLFAALNECEDEILGDLIDGTSFPDWKCNYNSPVNITIWDINFTDPMSGAFIPQTCFDF